MSRESSPHSAETCDRAMGFALALSILPYFLVRGWVTSAVVLLGLFCAISCVLGRVSLARALADRRVAWMAAALAAPLVAVVTVQLVRKEFVPRYFDGPLRFMLAGFILVYLMDRRVNILRYAQFAVPISVFLCAATLLYPGASAHFWGDRVASYFMDPLTLAQHVTIAGFMCLFLIDAQGKDSPWLRLLKYAGFGAALAISLWTQSRSAWLMMPILGTMWVAGYKRQHSKLGLGVAALLVASLVTGLYLFSPIVQLRVDTAVHEVLNYFNGGDRQTSVGVRLSLLQANWALFLASPVYGWGFLGVPAVSSIPGVAAFFTPMFEFYYVRSGGHNELLESAMRMGVLGLASRLMLFIVPLVLFARAARATHPRQRAAGYLGLSVVIGYFTAGLTSEVFNLIYTASFYALLVSALAAAAIFKDPE